MRVGDELRGSLASLSRAPKRSSGLSLLSTAIAFSAARLAAYCFAILARRLFFSTELFLAICLSPASVHEREVEAAEKRLGFRVRLRRRADDDVHASHNVDLVVVDLGEHDLLLQAHGEVATAVEGLAVQPAEVADARQRDVHQAVDELVHAVAPQRDLGADRHAFAQLEGRDRDARLGDHRLLAGDRRQVGHGAVDGLAVVDRLADAHVDHDLVQLRHLEGVLVAELLHERVADGLGVMLLQSRGHGPFSYRSIVSPEARAKRTFRPSSRNLKPTLVGLSDFGSSSATLDTWIAASRSMMPPASVRPGLVWRLMTLTPCTTTRCSAGRTRSTSPTLPLLRPAMTFTRSPFRIFMTTAPPARAR